MKRCQGLEGWGLMGGSSSSVSDQEFSMCQVWSVRFSGALATMAFSTDDANADLLNLMTCAKVPEEIQKKLYEAGVSSVKEFAALVTDEADMKKLLVKEFGIKEDDGLAERVKVSKVTVAWETA